MTHIEPRTPPWPCSDCRNAGLYFLRLRTIDYQLRTELLVTPLLTLFSSLRCSFVFLRCLPSLLFEYDTTDWGTVGYRNAFGNLGLSAVSAVSADVYRIRGNSGLTRPLTNVSGALHARRRRLSHHRNRHDFFLLENSFFFNINAMQK